MADKKISELDPIGAITGSSPIFPLVQGGNTVRVDAGTLAAYSSQWSATTASFNALLSGISTSTGSLIGITNGLMAFTAALDDTYATDAELNSFTESQNNVNLGISISTGSLNQFTSSFNTYTAALNASTESLVSYGVLSQSFANFTSSNVSLFGDLTIVSSSIIVDSAGNYIWKKTTGTQDFEIRTDVDSVGISLTSNNRTWRIDPDFGTLQADIYEIENSNGTKVFNSLDELHSFTASVDAHILGISEQTASQDLVNLGISIVSGSLNEQTASQDLVNLGISVVTASLNEQTASQDLVNLGISTFTGSIREEVNLIEAYTASLKGAIEISGQDVNVLGMITAQQFNVTYVSSSVQYQSGSTQFGDTSDDVHTFTGTINLNGLALGTAELMAQTASQYGVNLGISVVTGSLNQQTASQDLVNLGISVVTGSLNEQTSSQNAVNLGISVVTGSLNEQTASQDLVNLGISVVTGSLNEQTASQDLVNLGISIVTGSLNEQTASQDTVNFNISVFTSSIREEVNGIEAYTASLRTALSVTESMVHFNSAITASVVSSSYMKFDSLPNGTAPSYQEGLLYYDNDMGALTFYNNEADIALQIGQEQYIRVINKSGDDILNGTPVRVSGSQGDMVEIYKAEAFIHTGSYSDSEANNHILGLATHDILDDETGYVTISGLVKGINTDTYEAGDILYVQTGSAGVLTNLEPKFPYDKIQVGIVGRKHPSVGEILVLPKEPTHFGNITGLSGSATTEVGDLWVYKSNNAWATSKVLEGNYTFVGEQAFSGSLIPNVGVGEYTSSFSLGSATNAWKDLWVGEGSVNFVNASTGNTASISLGEDDVISVQEFRTSGSLQIGGNLVVTGSVYMYPGSGGITGSLEGTASYALSGAPNLATTGSNIFVGNQTLSGSVIPSQTPSQFTSSYSLGSEDNLWKKLWVGDISASGITYLSKTPGGIGTTGTLNIESGPGYEIVFKGSTSAVNILNEGLTPMYMGNVSYPTLFKMYNDVFTVGGTAQISEQLQITGSTIAVGGVTGSLEGTASYAITASYALNGGGGGGGIFTELAPSLYTTNNSLEVTGSLNVGGAITASLQEGYMWVGTPNGISTQIPTASMFTSSYILPDNLTGSVYVSSSFSGPGTLTLTKGDSSLDILTLGSSYVVSTIPENEIILSPTRSYNALSSNLADGAAATFANAANEFDFAFNGSTLYFIDDTNSQWADVGVGDYIKFNAEGSNVAGAYYVVGSAPYNVSAGSPAKNVWGFGSLTPVDSNNTFTGGGSASFQASISVPYSAYNPSNGTATYGSRYWELTSFGSSPGLAYTIQANVSSSYWLRLGTATGGTTHLDTGGYVGLSSDNSNWTYYIVTDEVYTDNVGGNDYIYHKIEPVDGAYAASNGSTAYVKGLKSIPAYPYNRTLSNLKYAQTIPSTSSTTGSASDISYDTDNLYVKTSEGWKAAPLGEFSSPTAVTSSVSYITGSVTIDRILKLDSNWTGGMPAGQAGQIIASSSYGFTNLYVHDGTEWKWLTTGSIQ